MSDVLDKIDETLTYYSAGREMGKPQGGRLPDFWSRVSRTESCWLWTGPVDRKGYGLHGGRGLAHRISWEMANGRAVPEGLFVLHHCDNPPCVNPAHLYDGTHQDNVNDMVARGRNHIPPRKTHCVHGHELNAANLILQKRKPENGKDYWRCRACSNASARERMRRRGAKNADRAV